MRYRRSSVFVLSLCCTAFLLPACAGPLEGPPVDLATIAAPEPLVEPVKPLMPIPGPTPGNGSFRAWTPAITQPNGDRIEGFWQTISLTPPPAERLEPPMPMPRSPKVHTMKPKADHPAGPPSAPAQAIPQSVLPTGLGSSPAQNPLLNRVPPRFPLGGQSQ